LDLSNNKKVGKVDNGMVIEKITPQEEEIVFVKDDKVVDVVETTKEAEEQAENVQDVIDGLEVLLETMDGAEKQELQDVIDGLKLLV
jgi:antitoxin component HigA of HigAB toxin-antitoxin module